MTLQMRTNLRVAGIELPEITAVKRESLLVGLCCWINA
jgi:hypothetical protein